MALALKDLGYSVHDFEEHIEVGKPHIQKLNSAEQLKY